MKLLKYTALACVLFTSSCGSSFLEVEPIGQLGKDQLFTDLSGLRSALVGSYGLAGKFFQSEYGIYGDLRADDVVRFNGGTQNYMLTDYNYTYNEDDQIGSTLSIWFSGYESVNNINNILNSADNIKKAVPSQAADIDAIVGQARILRGLTFLALANVYSQHYTYTADASHLGIPIPLVTPLPNERVPRASMKDTYTQIIADFEAGAQLLGNNAGKSKIYASKEAAEALLSRVYLYMERYDQVIEHSSKLIDSKKFTLSSATNYSEMFMANDQLTWQVAPEVIWQFTLNVKSLGSLSDFYSNRTSFLAGPTDAFMGLFDTDDVRKTMFLYNPTSERYMSLKNARKPDVIDLNWPINSKVIRLAEVYLNRAEAYFQQQKYNLAEADLKVIIGRAKGIAPAAVTLTYGSPAELLTLIKNERRKELAFEGQRIYDIMRYKSNLNRGTGCTSSVCSLTYPNDLFILPIPRAELDVNKSILPNPTVNK